MSSASNGASSASYAWLANSPLVDEVGYRQSGTTRMTTTRTYDYLNRLVSIASRTDSSGAVPLSYTYAYGDANQRTRVVHADGRSVPTQRWQVALRTSFRTTYCCLA